MNKRQKIIVSIIGIFIVLLALVGLTYGYFLTRIIGNTNEKSVSIKTSLLELKYDDEDNTINLSNIYPGQPIPSKTFSVSNTGQGDIEYGVYLENIINELVYQDDLLISLTCTSVDSKTGSETGTCNGISNDAKYRYPTTNEQILTNKIGTGIKHNYVLTVTYLDDGNQSVDMGKTIHGKVQIYAVSDVFDLIIDGTNLNATDVLELHSEVKTARRVNGVYKFVGVMTDEHTLKVKNSVGNELGTKSLIINRGTENAFSTDKNTLTVSEDSSYISISISGITNKTIEFDENVDYKLRPFAEGTLAYQIINNAKNVTNEEKSLGYAEYSNTPKTIVADEISRYESGKTELVTEIKKHLGNTSSFNWDNIYYGDTQVAADYNARAKSSSYKVSGETNLVKCESVIGKYISEARNLRSNTLGKVYDCNDEGYPYVDLGIDETTLSITTDDYGDSYYYRGAVKNNYINFAGMCWRIVRIEGDGSIKLILEDSDETCSQSMTGNWNIGKGNFGYTKYEIGDFSSTDGSKANTKALYTVDYLHGKTDFENSMATAFKNYQSTLNTKIIANHNGKTISDMLKVGNWCLNDGVYSKEGYNLKDSDLLSLTEKNERYASNLYLYSDSHVRLNKSSMNTPTLKCKGTIMSDFEDDKSSPTPMYVGTLTADEVVFAGGRMFSENLNFYLINDYLHRAVLVMTTLSPGVFTGVNSNNFALSSSFIHGAASHENNGSFRPSITLASSIIYSSGDGSILNPYIVQ